MRSNRLTDLWKDLYILAGITSQPFFELNGKREIQ